MKTAQIELEEKTRTLSLSLQAAQAGVWVWDIITNEITWDAMMEQMHGIEVGSFGGDYNSWQASVHPDDIDHVETSLQAAVNTISSWEIKFRIIRPDGIVRHILAQATMTTHPETNLPIRMIGVNIDITHRIEAEEKRVEIERARIEIEEKRKLIELKERFITTASHNFRTPLAIIQSSTDLLQRYSEHYSIEQQITKYERIQTQINHMTHLLDNVLTISKAHADKIQVSLIQIDLNEFINDIWSNVLILDSNAHLLEINSTATIESFSGDPQLLRQVFDNILNNALKYTPEGKRILFIIDNNEDSLIFKVTDEGYGIPQEDLDQLFNPFHRATNITNIKGTGLGLAIVKQYVDLHNGDISIQSKEGNGSTFIVTLPIQE